MLGSPSRGTKTFKGGTDSQPDSIPDGEGSRGERTRKRKSRAPVLSTWNSSRHFRLHRKRLARQFLSTGHAITRFPVLLCDSICDRRSVLDVLRMPFCEHAQHLVCPDSRRLLILRQSSPGRYARQSTSGLRCRIRRVRESDGYSWSQAWSD